MQQICCCGRCWLPSGTMNREVADLAAEVQRLQATNRGLPVDVAVQALADVLLSHDVPTGKVIVEFRRLVALYMADPYRRGQ